MVKSELFLCGAGLFAFFGVLFGLYSVAWCEFADITLPDGKTASFGPWRYKTFVIVEDRDGDLWKVDACGQIDDDWELDSKWKLARASSIIGPVLGALSGCALYVSSAAAGLGLLIAALFQGLVFLFFDSTACDMDENPYLKLIDFLLRREFEGCELGHSGIMGIIGTASFFLASLIACCGAVLAEDDEGDEAFAASAPEGEKEGEAEGPED